MGANRRRREVERIGPGVYSHQHAQRVSHRPDHLRPQGAGFLGPEKRCELEEEKAISPGGWPSLSPLRQSSGCPHPFPRPLRKGWVRYSQFGTGLAAPAFFLDVTPSRPII